MDNLGNCLLDSDRAEGDRKNDPDLNWSGNIDMGIHKCKVKKRKRKYVECDSQVQCDDRDGENGQMENSLKKQRTTHCSSHDGEPNSLDLGKGKKRKHKKMKAQILSSTSVLETGNEVTKSCDHLSEQTGRKSEKMLPPSCSEIGIGYTDVCSNKKKKKFRNPQLDCTDSSETCTSNKIREFKQTVQSSVSSKSLTDVTETSNINLSKKKRADKNSSFKELKLDSELSNCNINKKAKKQKYILPDLGTEIRVRDTDYLAAKRKGTGESCPSSSFGVNTGTRETSDNQLSRNDKESSINQDVTKENTSKENDVGYDSNASAIPITVNPQENKQYDSDSKSSFERIYCQLSESEGISIDDTDYDDEHYKVSFKSKRRPRSQKLNGEPLNCNLNGEPPNCNLNGEPPKCNLNGEPPKCEPLNRNLITTDEDKPRSTFLKDCGLKAVFSYNVSMYNMNKELDQNFGSDEPRNSRLPESFDDILYRFPPGEGIPPEEIEDIPEKNEHWKAFYNRLFDNSFTVEEIKEEIESKVNFIHGYFKRLEEHKLTEQELQEVRPRNYDDPYFPTYKHLEFFENLNIKITWALSPLHEAFLDIKGCTKNFLKPAREERSGFISSKRNFTDRENELILRNWLKFQEEYEFYDLRPMVTLRTTRISKEGGVIRFKRFHYLNSCTERRFAVYLSRGLPDRSPDKAVLRLKLLSTYLKGNTLQKRRENISGRILGKMVLILKMYGKSFHGIELIIGHHSAEQFRSFFEINIWMQNINLRNGYWTEEESLRLRRGIYAVHKERSMTKAFRKKIKWMRVMPYVRTRNYRNLRQRLECEISDIRRQGKFENKVDKGKMIELIYESGIDSMNAIDWQDMTKHFRRKNPYRLRVMFRDMYYSKIPHEHRLTFENGITYMYEKIRPLYLRYAFLVNDDGSDEKNTEAEEEVLFTADTTVGNDDEESSENADGNVDNLEEYENLEEFETSDNDSIDEDIANNYDLMCEINDMGEGNANSEVENQELVNTKARSLEPSHQIHCSKDHYMSASDSE